MKCAIVHSLDWCHYEVLGAFVDYCLKREFALDLVLPKLETSEHWLSFYFKLNNCKSSLHKPRVQFLDVAHFDENQQILYDVIIISTGADPVCHRISERVMDRVVVLRHNTVKHIPEFRYRYELSTRRFQGVRQDLLDPERLFLPVCTSIADNVAKTPSEGRFRVGVISSTNMDPRVLERIGAAQEVDFVFVGRVLDEHRSFFKEIHIKPAASLMYDIISKCDYVVVNKKEKDEYFTEKMTGAIPAAISCKVRLLIPESMLRLGYPNLVGHVDTFDASDKPIVLGQPSAVNVSEIVEQSHASLDSIIQEMHPDYVEPEPRPDKINMVWLDKLQPFSDNVPIKYTSNIAKLRRINDDCDLVVWTNKRMARMFDGHEKLIGKYRDMFDRIYPHISKCDLARLLVVYVRGGWYVDMDFHANLPFRRYSARSAKGGLAVFNEISEHQVSLPTVQVFNGIFRADAEHAFIGHLLDSMLSDYNRGGYRIDKQRYDEIGPIPGVMARTGPVKWGSFWQQHYQSKLTLLNGSDVMPFTGDMAVSKEYNGPTAPITYTCWSEGTGWGHGSGFLSSLVLDSLFTPTISETLSTYSEDTEDVVDEPVAKDDNTYFILTWVFVGLTILLLGALVGLGVWNKRAAF